MKQIFTVSMILMFLLLVIIFGPGVAPVSAYSYRDFFKYFRKQMNNETTESITICVKNSGLIYVVGQGFRRTDCKKNDKLFDINVDSINGKEGPIGPKGDNGIDGKDGISCWDSNSDGIRDLLEDVNNDGVVDVNDCRGQTGLTGEKGNPGIDGVNGQNGISGSEIVTATSANDSADKTVTATCSGTKKVVGGGGKISVQSGTIAILDSYPSADNQWSISAVETKSYSLDWNASCYAICVDAL